MRTATKKHISVREGKARFAQVTVAALSAESDRVSGPELFLNDRRITQLTDANQKLIAAAVRAVKEEEIRRRNLLCVTRIDSSYVDAHPEAARLGALAAVAALFHEEEGA